MLSDVAYFISEVVSATLEHLPRATGGIRTLNSEILSLSPLPIGLLWQRQPTGAPLNLVALLILPKAHTAFKAATRAVQLSLEGQRSTLSAPECDIIASVQGRGSNPRSVAIPATP